MKSVKGAKLLWLCLGISSLIIGLTALFLVAVFGLKLMYIPMTVSVLFVAYGAYSAVFYFNRLACVSLYGRIIAVACENPTEESIAKILNMKPECLSPIVKKGIKEGFIRENLINS